jgi:hypothetical protein
MSPVKGWSVPAWARRWSAPSSIAGRRSTKPARGAPDAICDPYSTQLGRLTQGSRYTERASNAAEARARQVLYDMLQRQSAMLAVTDVFRFVAFVFLVAVPLVVLLKRYDPRTARAAVH